MQVCVFVQAFEIINATGKASVHVQKVCPPPQKKKFGRPKKQIWLKVSDRNLQFQLVLPSHEQRI